MPLHELEMDLTPDEHNMLVDLHNWISTPVQTGRTAAMTPSSPLPRAPDPLGYLQRANVEVRQTWTRCGPWNPHPPRRLSWRRRPLCPS